MVSSERLRLSEEREKKPHRVVIVASCDFGLVGGGQESTRNLALAWETKGIETYLISPFSPENSWSFAKVITLPTIDFPLSAHKIPLSPYQLNKLLKESEPASILLTHPGIFSSLLFFAMKKKWRERTSAIWRGIVTPPLTFNKKLLERIKLPSKLRLKRILRPFFLSWSLSLLAKTSGQWIEN